MNYYTDVLKKYAVFTGRATRKEYWMFALYNILVALGIGIIVAILEHDSSNNLKIIQDLYSLAVFLPCLGVTIRRLHDTNHSGWWIFINLIPIIGQIIFLVFLATDSQPSSNTYGPNPKESKPA
jgi:uncharacterized membrane protein YhaH (DUF805 family)